MTRHGKCETCRRRKVKCDEALPRCGPCNVKKRTCTYPSSIFVHDQKSLGKEHGPVEFGEPDVRLENKAVTLRLRRSRKAQDGEGAFLTFGPSASHSPSPTLPHALLPADTGQVALWGSLFGYECLSLCPLGDWLRFAWPTSGETAFLEQASQYAMESMLAFQQQHSEDSMRRASALGVVALRSLQDTIDTWPDGLNREALIVAIMLHFAAENFLGIATWRYIPHLRGVCRLLAASTPEEVHSPAMQSVISSICAHEVITSILLGEPSQLEDVPRPAISPEGTPSLDLAARITEDLLIALPRLVCYVRASSQDHDDLQSLALAIGIAKELFDSDADLWVRKTLLEYSQAVPVVAEKDAPPFDERWTFDSASVFMLFIRYYEYRMTICELMQTLAAIDRECLFLDPEIATEARAGTIESAMSFAKCLGYALRPGATRNLLAMEMLWPLEACAAIFTNIQADQSSIDMEEHQHAGKMIEWCIASLCKISQAWRAGCIPLQRLQDLYEVFKGGPLVLDAYDSQGHGDQECVQHGYVEVCPSLGGSPSSSSSSTDSGHVCNSSKSMSTHRRIAIEDDYSASMIDWASMVYVL